MPKKKIIIIKCFYDFATKMFCQFYILKLKPQKLLKASWLRIEFEFNILLPISDSSISAKMS